MVEGITDPSLIVHLYHESLNKALSNNNKEDSSFDAYLDLHEVVFEYLKRAADVVSCFDKENLGNFSLDEVINMSKVYMVTGHEEEGMFLEDNGLYVTRPDRSISFHLGYPIIEHDDFDYENMSDADFNSLEINPKIRHIQAFDKNVDLSERQPILSVRADVILNRIFNGESESIFFDLVTVLKSGKNFQNGIESVASDNFMAERVRVALKKLKVAT